MKAAVWDTEQTHGHQNLKKRDNRAPLAVWMISEGTCPSEHRWSEMLPSRLVKFSLTNETGTAQGRQRCRGVGNRGGEFRLPNIVGLFLTVSADYAGRERRQGVDVAEDDFDVLGGEGADDTFDVCQCLRDAKGVCRGTMASQRIVGNNPCD